MNLARRGNSFVSRVLKSDCLQCSSLLVAHYLYFGLPGGKGGSIVSNLTISTRVGAEALIVGLD
jgi:hypothetical protein